MNKKVRWITETAILLALLVTLQALTKPAGQLVTGSCVNAILAVAALVGGPLCGVTVALISPVLAFLLGIAPQVLTVPAIMAGNTVFVLALSLLWKPQRPARQIAAWLVGAAAKFATLYALVSWVLCGVLAQPLLDAGVMKPPMLTALPAMFSWPQLITALVGGGLALLLVPVLKKALKKQ